LLNQDTALSPMSHGDIESTKSPLPDRGGPNYMHGPLLCRSVVLRSILPALLRSSKVHQCSRECIVTMIPSEMGNDFKTVRTFVGEEFDGTTLFNFHRFNMFYPMK
jgi:hypothetical protein